MPTIFRNVDDVYREIIVILAEHPEYKDNTANMSPFGKRLVLAAQVWDLQHKLMAINTYRGHAIPMLHMIGEREETDKQVVSWLEQLYLIEGAGLVTHQDLCEWFPDGKVKDDLHVGHCLPDVPSMLRHHCGIE